MSLFAGVIDVYDRRTEEINEFKNSFLSSIDRENMDLITFESENSCIIKGDIGVFPEIGYYETPGKGFAILAGDPLLKDSYNLKLPRDKAIYNLYSNLKQRNYNILNECNGNFALCYYDLMNDIVILAVDKVGTRPIYFTYSDNLFYFSTCLKALEAHRSINKRIDLVGISEKLAINSYIGNRTKYANIKTLKGGQYLIKGKSDLNIIHYFRWDMIERSNVSSKTFLKEMYDTFLQAVKDRLPQNEQIISFLSGGLDSRCVVTALYDLTKSLITYNLGYAGTQDYVFGNKFAKNINSRHFDLYSFKHELSDMMSYLDGMKSLIDHLNINESLNNISKLIFSGEGGSVGLGHVYMTEDINKLMRQNQIDKVIHLYLKNKKLPKRLLKPYIYERLNDAIYEDLRKELNLINSYDRARNFYIFLIDNDQRWHLRRFYENIDFYNFELATPFFDSRFLEKVVSFNTDDFLYHKFYTEWLELFPTIIRKVPWQTYKNHVPCPIPISEGAIDQWTFEKKIKEKRESTYLSQLLKNLVNLNFAFNILNPSVYLPMILLHFSRYKNYSSEFKWVSTLQNIYDICNGDFEIK